jgi:hypothetical protein
MTRLDRQLAAAFFGDPAPEAGAEIPEPEPAQPEPGPGSRTGVLIKLPVPADHRKACP